MYADVDEVGAFERLVDVERVAQTLRVAREQLLEARLEDRHLAAAKRVDLLRHDVADGDVVPELGEARAGYEADIAGAEDSDPRHGCLPYRLGSGFKPFAIAIIVSFESVSVSVLTTQ